MTRSSKPVKGFISNISSDGSYKEKEERTDISIHVCGLEYRFASFYQWYKEGN